MVDCLKLQVLNKWCDNHTLVINIAVQEVDDFQINKTSFYYNAKEYHLETCDQIVKLLLMYLKN